MKMMKMIPVMAPVEELWNRFQSKKREKKQQLTLAIIDFLNQSIEDGTVKQDDREGLEVAGELHPTHRSVSFN